MDFIALTKAINAAHAALAIFIVMIYLRQPFMILLWNEFCDWYLELSKPILTSTESTPEMLRGTRHTLVNVLEILLRLLHPIMPFITEEIWQRVAPLAGKNGPTIMLESYPQTLPSLIDEHAEKELEWLQHIIVAIRTIRSEMNIAPGKPLAILFRKGNVADKENHERHQRLLIALAKLESINWIAETETPPSSATAFVGELEIFIPMAGFMNKEEELARLNKEIAKVQKEVTFIQTKLSNPQFVDKAPADVVAKEKEKLAEGQGLLLKMQGQLESMEYTPSPEAIKQGPARPA